MTRTQRTTMTVTLAALIAGALMVQAADATPPVQRLDTVHVTIDRALSAKPAGLRLPRVEINVTRSQAATH